MRETQMGLLRNPDVRYPVVITLLAMILWLPRLRGPLDLRFDAGVYYILGTSLAEGKGYRLLNEPGEITALQYPPALPALVAIEQKLLGTNDPEVVGQWLRWTYCGMFLLLSLSAYAIARQVLNPRYSFLAAVICTLSADGVYLSDLLQAELPFAVTTALFIIFSGVLRGQPPEGTPPPSRARETVNFTLASIFGIVTFLIRSAGIALLGAWVGEAVLRGNFKAATFRLLIAAIPFVAWQAWVSHVKHSAEYNTPTYEYQRAAYQYYNVDYKDNLRLVDPFHPEWGFASKRDLVNRVIGNLPVMPLQVGNAVSMSLTSMNWTIFLINKRVGRTDENPIVPWKISEYTAKGYSLIVLFGVLIFLSRRRWFVPLYLAATLFLICITPWPKQFMRYLWPSTPVLVVCLLVAFIKLRDLLPQISRVSDRKLASALLTMVLFAIPIFQLGNVAYAFRLYHDPVPYGKGKLFYISAEWMSWEQAVDWLGKNSQPTDVIATSAPHCVYLKLGRKSVLPPMEADPNEELRLMDSVPVKYVIVGSFEFLEIDSRYVQPMIDFNPQAWKLVYTAPDGLTKVYERVNRD